MGYHWNLLALLGGILLGAMLLVSLGGSLGVTAPIVKFSPEEPAMQPERPASRFVYVRIIDQNGSLVGPVLSPRVTRSEAEWRERLTPEQYRIIRRAGTEPAFCGGLLKNKEAGIYTCLGCSLPLFSSDTKFESGTGWPSFFQPVGPENILERTDTSLARVRTEILCPRCESHLGHVFPDGPAPTGMRYCLNSESLVFVEQGKLAAIGESAAQASVAEVVLAGGCFWCVEAVFRELDGVYQVVSGYAGGAENTANYKAVCSGTTGHAEVVKITYDPQVISIEELLQVHFATHDPTTLNRQGADEGTQYRSAIFYANQQEKELAAAFIADLNESGAYSAKVVTTLEPLTAFYPAEGYHQNYVCRNPDQPYIRGVALPKVKKVREKFAGKLKGNGE